MKKNLGPAFLPVAGFAIGVLFLVLSASRTEGVVYTPLEEVTRWPGAIRFEGRVVLGSVRRDSLPVRFAVGDTQGRRVEVEFHDALPDVFREERDVVVRGRYDVERKLVLAEEVLARCPSKYEGQGLHPETATVPPR